jgi:hypothetical protein
VHKEKKEKGEISKKNEAFLYLFFMAKKIYFVDRPFFK